MLTRKRQDMASHCYYYTAKSFRRAPPLRAKNAITRLAGAATNLTGLKPSGRRGDRSQVQILSPRPVTLVLLSDRSDNMKIITMFAAIILAGTLRAQEATDADLAAKSVQKNTNAESAGARPENVPELSQLDEMFKQTPMGKAADAQRLRVEWRQLKNKVVNDPDLIAIRRTAEAARTDLEKREKLRAYYKLYFARVRQFPMSPEMKQHVDAMQASQLGLTAQSRVRPSPTASPAATN